MFERVCNDCINNTTLIYTYISTKKKVNPITTQKNNLTYKHFSGNPCICVTYLGAFICMDYGSRDTFCFLFKIYFLLFFFDKKTLKVCTCVSECVCDNTHRYINIFFVSLCIPPLKFLPYINTNNKLFLFLFIYAITKMGVCMTVCVCVCVSLISTKCVSTIISTTHFPYE